jgi:hypothetical protein
MLRLAGFSASAPPARGKTMKQRPGQNLRSALILAEVCALAVFFFLLAYSNDNKYTASQPHAVNGVLRLDAAALDAYPVLFLISGWEFYGGQLLTPQDFALGRSGPAQNIYIGQYGGFEAGNEAAPPHGSATYRLTIVVPAEPREYMLELPEIFSAYRAYINGAEVLRMGDPAPASYRPQTGNRSLTFSAGGSIEIIIAASDFSHLYSGLTYPPAFGKPESVANLLSSRLVIRSAVCAAALFVALLALLIGLLSKNRRLTVLYALLCLCFAAYVSYPILNTFAGAFQPFYAIENTSFCLVLLLAMRIQYVICGSRDSWSRYFICFGILCCAAAAMLPFAAFFHSVPIMYGFSRLISAYEYITACYLSFMAVHSILKKNIRLLTLLCGILVFDCALLMDRLLPLYEPIRGGWFIESASFALVIAIGAVIGQEVAGKYRENAVLSERAHSMESLAGMQQGYYTVLRQEMEEIKAARHDLHHHFTLMKGYLQNKQFGELATYIAAYQGPAYSDEPLLYSENHVINILFHHYNMLCKHNRVFFDVRSELSGPLRLADADLCGLLSNLLENALEACLRIESGRRSIRLGLMELGDDLIIRTENTTDGSVKHSGDTFLSSKGSGRTGYGLLSVRAIVKRYHGTVEFSWDEEKRVFTSVAIMCNPN